MAHERRGAIHVGLPWRGLLPLPDGTISNLDRRQAAYCYPLVAEVFIVQIFDVAARVTRRHGVTGYATTSVACLGAVQLQEALTGYITTTSNVTQTLRRELTDGS